MKKFYLSLLLIFSAVLAYSAPEPYAHLGMYESMDKTFLKHFVYGDKTTYQVCTYPLGIEEEKEENETNHTNFLNALNIWLNTTENYIRTRENGENEFKDILKILENIKNLKRLPCEYDTIDGNLALVLNSDLNVLFAFHNEDQQEIGYYNFSHKSMVINKYMEDEDSIYRIPDMPIILHEMGHIFGLADRYEGALYKGSFIYNSLSIRPSVMMDYNTITEEITCDDVDGFITSVDRIRNKKRTFKSFCNDGIVLVNGKAKKLKSKYTYNYKETFSYNKANYEADINVIFDKKSASQKTYIMDITLQNFEKAPGTIDLLNSLGFNTSDLDLAQDIKANIHAPIKENIDGFREPIGLTTLTLTVNNKRKQIVSVFYNKRNDSYIRTSLDPYKTEIILKSIDLPIMHYAPDYKHEDYEEDEIEDIIIILINQSLEELMRTFGIK